MEPPSKRPRLSLATQDEDDTENGDLQEARFQNDQRLKSIFEGIFQKYEKDFTEVGDEIDLQTGKIVTNNGHLQGMDDERDTGEKEEDEEGKGKVSWLFGLGADWSAEEPDPHGQTEEGNPVNETTGSVETQNGVEDLGDWETASSRQEQQSSPILRPDLEATREQESQDEAANADLDSQDDRSSVDSLLDTALDIQSNLRDSLAKRARRDTGKSDTEKAISAAEIPVQSKGESGHNLAGPVESLWRVPEINANFSTPTWHRSRPKPAIKAARSKSPPEAGSIWALPGSSRRSTVSAKKRSPKKPRAGQRGRKIVSSPVVFDWSFAETPDGSESDDPLQENIQPSPTPKDTVKIRGKMSTLGASTKEQCAYCRRVFTHDDYVAHLKAVLTADPPDDQHEISSVRRKLDAVTNDKATRRQPDTPKNVSTPCIHPDSTEISSKGNAATTQDSTPTNKKRMGMTPDEARTIVITKQVEGKKWREVLEFFPQRNERQLIQWNQIHWNDRRANPPQQSGPWSGSERKTLDDLKGQRGLTWTAIRAALPGRSHAELEFQLLRLWAGDDVWNNQQMKETTE